MPEYLDLLKITYDLQNNYGTRYEPIKLILHTFMQVFPIDLKYFCDMFWMWLYLCCDVAFLVFRSLCRFAFSLSLDWELPRKKLFFEDMKVSVREMLVRHHLFSWELWISPPRGFMFVFIYNFSSCFSSCFCFIFAISLHAFILGTFNYTWSIAVACTDRWLCCIISTQIVQARNLRIDHSP